MDYEQELNRLADAYRAQGYDVTVRPGPDRLPPFAKDFRVEILGRRGAEGVLAAVRKNRDEVAADGNMQRYAEITGAQPGWRFDFAILESEKPNAREVRGAKELSEDDINKSLGQARYLAAWASRGLRSSQLGQPWKRPCGCQGPRTGRGLGGAYPER